MLAPSMLVRGVAVSGSTTPYRDAIAAHPKTKAPFVLRAAATAARLVFGIDCCTRFRWYRRAVGGRWIAKCYCIEVVCVSVSRCYCPANSPCECEVWP